MLTIFSSTKPFIGINAWNQINAIKSWRGIHIDIEIIIFGSFDGITKEIEGIKVVPLSYIDTSTSGAPSFNSMVEWITSHSNNELFVYANCDILLNFTILRAMQLARNKFEKFLLVGERMDLAAPVKLDVSQNNWENKLTELSISGNLYSHGPTGADYFGFVRGMWQDLPLVYMGRGMCDQALIHYCFLNRIPVIDATKAVVNIHQHHDYEHVSQGKQQVFFGEERQTMKRAHNLHYSLPTIADANWIMGSTDMIFTNKIRRRLLRHLELMMRYQLRIEAIALILRILQYWQGKKGIKPVGWPAKEILTSWESLTKPSP